jgi:hypothetical protein
MPATVRVQPRTDLVSTISFSTIARGQRQLKRFKIFENDDRQLSDVAKLVTDGLLKLIKEHEGRLRKQWRESA